MKSTELQKIAEAQKAFLADLDKIEKPAPELFPVRGALRQSLRALEAAITVAARREKESTAPAKS